MDEPTQPQPDNTQAAELLGPDPLGGLYKELDKTVRYYPPESGRSIHRGIGMERTNTIIEPMTSFEVFRKSRPDIFNTESCG